MKFDWNNFDYVKPKTSGFYFVEYSKTVEIMYYDVTIERFICFDFDSMIVLPFCYAYINWAKMPRYHRSKLLYDGLLRMYK